MTKFHTMHYMQDSKEKERQTPSTMDNYLRRIGNKNENILIQRRSFEINRWAENVRIDSIEQESLGQDSIGQESFVESFGLILRGPMDLTKDRGQCISMAGVRN